MNDLQRSPTGLYRIFNADDELLYIGISKAPRTRVREHLNGKMWGDEGARHTVEWHSTRRAALDAERTAIQAENPRYNITHTSLLAKMCTPGAQLTVEECERVMRCWYPGWLRNKPDNATDEVHAEAVERIKRWRREKRAAARAAASPPTAAAYPAGARSTEPSTETPPTTATTHREDGPTTTPPENAPAPPEPPNPTPAAPGHATCGSGIPHPRYPKAA